MIHTTMKIGTDSGMRKKQETPRLVSFGYGFHPHCVHGKASKISALAGRQAARLGWVQAASAPLTSLASRSIAVFSLLSFVLSKPDATAAARTTFIAAAAAAASVPPQV